MLTIFRNPLLETTTDLVEIQSSASIDVTGDFTGDKRNIIEGKREELVSQLQKKYGLSREKAEEQADD